MKNYEVWKINEKGIYEKVAEGISGTQAGAIAKALRSKGIWTQVCKAGENKIITD